MADGMIGIRIPARAPANPYHDTGKSRIILPGISFENWKPDPTTPCSVRLTPPEKAGVGLRRQNMKRLAILLNFLWVTAATAGDNFPYFFGTNWTTTHDGLHLSAVVDKTTYRTNERPSITVTFSNESSTIVVLLNHFAFTAVGPLFRPLLSNLENPKQYREVSFAEQISIRKTNPPWIILKPGQTHRFQSTLQDLLPTGDHSLRVQYSVAGPAESMIAECRKGPSCPADFWHGDLLSNGVKIEVKPESPTKPRTVP